MSANITPEPIENANVKMPESSATLAGTQVNTQLPEAKSVVKPMIWEAERVVAQPEPQMPAQTRSSFADFATQQRDRRDAGQLGMEKAAAAPEPTQQDKSLDMMRSNVRFEDDADAIVRETPNYLDQRNNFLAKNATNKLKEKVRAWEEITMQWIDDLVMETVQGFWWQPDMNNPDRPRAIEDIRNRIVQASWLELRWVLVKDQPEESTKI